MLVLVMLLLFLLLLLLLLLLEQLFMVTCESINLHTPTRRSEVGSHDVTTVK